MHDGANARAWVTIGTEADQKTLSFAELAFAAVPGEIGGRSSGAIDWNELKSTPGAMIFEPVRLGTGDHFDIVAAHSVIQFYTWQRTECCLPAGSTRATLDDGSVGAKKDDPLRLRLKVDDILIFEETREAVTGSGADADPAHRHVVRLTAANPSVDPLTSTRIWEIEWIREDALPFDLRLSIRTPAPECEVKSSAVVRGNVVLVDHGVTMDIKDNSWVVGVQSRDLCCLCDGANTERQTLPQPLTIELSPQPVTQADPVPKGSPSAAALMVRDVRSALPAVWLDAAPGADNGTPAVPPQWPGDFAWKAARDLLSTGPADRCFAVEIDDEGTAHLRFGDGVHGLKPDAGWRFRVRQRIGNGPAGNVGHDSIGWISLKTGPFSGMNLTARNPFAASGGTAPESIEDVKSYAPYAYGRILERAVAATDYAQLAADDPRVQGAFAELAWTGSWYEASVALDTVARYTVEEVEPGVSASLRRARRIGHDLRIVAARRVPLDIELAICIEANHLRGDVEKAVRAILSSSTLPDGSLGMFHPDQLQFGADVFGSPIVAAVQAIDGVVYVELTRFARFYASDADAARSLEDNVIVIARDEIAQLDGDVNFPERGRLTLDSKGGR